MKKVSKILLAAILLLALVPFTVADAQTKTVLGVSTVYEQRATTVEFSVFLDSDAEIAAGSFDLTYDPDLLTVRDTGVTAGEAAADYLTSVNAAEPGVISMAFAKAEGRKVNGGTLLTVKASVRKSNTSNDLKFNKVHLITKDGKDVSTRVVNGAIKPFDGRTDQHDKKVSGTKEWTITLSKPYDAATLNSSTVTVKRGTTTMDVTITPVTSDSFKVTPVTPYTRGNYTIEVTEQLHSANGAKLKQPIRKAFSVE